MYDRGRCNAAGAFAFPTVPYDPMKKPILLPVHYEEARLPEN